MRFCVWLTETARSAYGWPDWNSGPLGFAVAALTVTADVGEFGRVVTVPWLQWLM